jgi:hypothetical protein
MYGCYTIFTMASHNHEPMLPKVEESDLLGLVVEEVIDPKHAGWWKELALDNPLLAQQIIKRAYFDTQDKEGTSSLELQKIIIDSVTFAIRALKAAAERQKNEAQQIAGPLPAVSDEVA